MNWLQDLLQSDSAPRSILILVLVAACGLAAGNLKFRGVGLGVAGVLFVGLLVGHLGVRLDAGTLELVRNASLILFVYAIGVQVGPGFLASLRHNGLTLNSLAVLIVAGGCLVTVVLGRAAGMHPGVMAGVYAGAVTNTPALAAAQQALREAGAWVPGQTPALGYAASYPFGVLGIILSIVLLKRLLALVAVAERAEEENEAGEVRPLSVLNIEVVNEEADHKPLREVVAMCGSAAVISRHLHGSTVYVAHPENTVTRGDVLLAVGPREELDRLCAGLGRESRLDLRALPSPVRVRQIVVTRRDMQGRPIEELGLHVQGVAVTRVQRNNVQFSPSPGLRLHFGDVLQVVGEEEALRAAEEVLGNSSRSLDHPQVIPILLGVSLGVVLGSWPIHLPGMAAPVRLGLAGGPLLAALILSRIGRIGPLIWYLPAAANFTIRELSIALFLACVGLSSGEHFAQSILKGDGLIWMACGAGVTVLPLLVAGVIGRLLFRLDFTTLSGLLAGSMTDPPALAFASSMTSSERAYVSYAAVYPLTMVLRVVTAQLLVLWMIR